MSNEHSPTGKFVSGSTVDGDQSGQADIARWLPRVAAKTIDGFVVWFPFTLIWFAGMYFAARGEDSIASTLYTAAWIEGVAGWGFVIYRTGTTGQSIGKRIVGTSMVGRDGQLLGFWHALLHETVSLFVDLIPLFIGYLWPLVDSKRRTFSDAILGTVTYRVPPARSAGIPGSTP